LEHEKLRKERRPGEGEGKSVEGESVAEKALTKLPGGG